MKGRLWLLIEQAIVLMAAVVPVSLAEGAWWCPAAVVLAVAIGCWREARNRKPLLGPISSRVFVLAAFGLLLYEYLWRMTIPVLALAHFMILVCVSKFLQERSLRDDAQLLVLCLLLLVVASIVSGSVIFLVVLVVYLSLGLDLLARFSMSLERAYVRRANRAVIEAPGDAAPDDPPFRGATGPMLSMAAVATTVGVLVFMFFPRVGGGMFGREARGGMAVTGFSSVIGFEDIGPIAESERQLMNVKVETSGGRPVPAEPLYLRGQVFDYYAARRGPGRRREWRHSARREPRVFELRDKDEDEFDLLPGYDDSGDDRLLIQTITIEAGAIREPVLFSLYPPVAIGGISSSEVNSVIESLEDQALRTARPVNGLLKYTVKSAAGLTPEVHKALLEAWRAEETPEPVAHPPDLSSSDAARIIALVQPLVDKAGSPAEPATRRRFAELLDDWLHSGEFTYTLSPPPTGRGVDPVCDFLLNTRRGHCQYFASAMAVVCQLEGVPARLVSGFRCDAYNQMGRFWSVRGKHAHAWVEVYIPAEGWVRFDPTPAVTVGHADGGGWLQRLRSCSDYMQFQWANLVLTYGAEARRDMLQRFEAWILRPARKEPTVVGMVAAFIYELFAWRMQMSWHDRMLYWGFALLVVAMVVLIGYVVVVLAWRAYNRLAQFILSRRTATGRAGDALFYHRLCRRLSALGFRRRPEQTPAEFAADLAARDPRLQPAVNLVKAYYGVTYGREGLSPERREEFEGFLRQLSRIDRAAFEGS
jgi:transglutaminase-like putative cysteine protease